MSTGSISSLGIGSGIDIQSILDQLKAVDQQPIDAKQDEITELESKGEELDAINLSLLTMRSSALDLSLGSNFLENEVTTSGTSIEATSISSSKEISHVVNVTSLASFSAWTSEGMASSTEILTTTDMTFSYKLGEDGNSINLNVEAGSTLEDLMNLINDDESNPGVTASIVNTGIGSEPYKLVLQSDNSGEDNRIFINNDDSPLKLTESTGAGYTAPESDNKVNISASEPIEISAQNANNTIVFQERLEDGSLGEATTATIADGSYTSGSDMAAAIEEAMESASENKINYSVTYDETTKKFTIAEDGDDLYELKIAWNESSAASELGFDAETDSYTPYESSLNAKFTVDGIDYQRQSNDDIEDVISGISLNLKETGSSSIFVKPDFELVENTMQDIVDTLNALVSSLDEKSAYDIDSGEKGILFGESAITGIGDDLKSFMEQKLNLSGNITSLYDLGFNIESDGTISIDMSVFEDALSESAEDVIKFFTGDSDNGVTGFGDLLYDKIKSYTDADGLLPAEGDSIQTRINKLEEQIENDTSRLEARYDTLTMQYIEMDQYIQEMNSMSDYLEQIFGSTDE